MEEQYTYYGPDHKPEDKGTTEQTNDMTASTETPNGFYGQQESERQDENQGFRQYSREETERDPYSSEGRNTYQYSRAILPESPTNPKPKKKKHTSGLMKAVAFGLVFGLTAGCAFQCVNIAGNMLYGNHKSTSSGKTAGTTELTTSTAGALNAKSDIVNIAANAMPSVVSITNMSVQQVRSFFGGMQEYQSESCGSGIIIGQNDAELLVLTNNHVVKDADTLTVTFINEESISAQVKGTDANLDVAVVSVPLSDIADSTMDAIKIATLGDSDSLQVGETAIAIGNALGYGQSVTSGIISALGRTLEGYEGGALIQTDAAINPGNSGGALLNVAGEVIGINVAKVATSQVEGMGYAIPITDASEVITNLMNKATRNKVAEGKQGYIGIQGVDVSKETAQFYNIPVGVYINGVIEGGGAEKAGLAKGTVITALDGTTIDCMDTLLNELQYYAVGDTVTLTVQIPTEKGEYLEKDIQVTLGKAS